MAGFRWEGVGRFGSPSWTPHPPYCAPRASWPPIYEGREWGSSTLIRPKCITILYCDFTLCIDIFHFKVLFLCCFRLFYTVCNFPVPEQQNQDLAVESGHQVAESDQVQLRWKFTGMIFMENDWGSSKMEVRGPTRQPEGCLARPPS